MKEEIFFNHITRLDERINGIYEVISAQHDYASLVYTSKKYSLISVIEDALIIQSEILDINNITVKKNFVDTPPIKIQKIKLLYVLINIITNSIEAMSDILKEQRELILTLSFNSEYVFLKIKDNGEGIKKEHIDKVFSQGFSTKKNRLGLGLHSSAIYMKEMGSEIGVEIDGDKGAVFLLKFPLLE